MNLFCSLKIPLYKYQVLNWGFSSFDLSQKQRMVYTLANFFAALSLFQNYDSMKFTFFPTLSACIFTEIYVSYSYDYKGES